MVRSAVQESVGGDARQPTRFELPEYLAVRRRAALQMDTEGGQPAPSQLHASGGPRCVGCARERQVLEQELPEKVLL